MRESLPLSPEQLAELSEAALCQIGQSLLSLQKEDSLSPEELAKKGDLWSSQAIGQFLAQLPFEANCLDEEQGFLDRRSPYTWVVDPIDGSTNFGALFPLWSISLCLCVHGRPYWGCVYTPVLGRFYWGARGVGAFCNGVPISTDKSESFGSGQLFVYESGVERLPRQPHFPGKFRRLGSVAIDLAFLAEGKCVAFYAPECHLWDVLGGYVIAREAGAVFSSSLDPVESMDGRSFSLWAKANAQLPDIRV